MQRLTHAWILAAALFLCGGCSHRINITPPLDNIPVALPEKVQKTAAYYISPADMALKVTTAGGGGDKVHYFPYAETEPALRKALTGIFARVVNLPDPTDSGFIQENAVAYVFMPHISTNSTSSSIMFWPPSEFTIELDCRATDPAGATLWQKTVTGKGNAEFDEFKHDFQLAPRRAVIQAFSRLGEEIVNSGVFK